MNELDDFQNIEDSGTGSKSVDLSNIFNIKVGGFGANNTLYTYFGSSKIKNLLDDISLYETLTKDKSWPVSQIIQREVDKFRVAGISKSYILGEGRLIKYFPPIIIAILPKTSDGKIELSLNFSTDNSELIKNQIYEKSEYSSNEQIKPYVIKANNISLIDGLYVLEVSKVFDTRLLAWDKNKYYAIVIDGQHRLESLFKSMVESPIVGDYLQDVVFLDFSPLINVKPELTPVEVVRRVFVDINTNAQRVGFVRQVLMDDKDLSSLCVQSLVDSSYKDGSLKPEESYIKSQIVDWYGEKLKHVLPHLTGVLSLYQIIDDFLIKDSLTTLRDLRSPKKVSNWVARVNNLFMVDETIKTDSRYIDSGIRGLYDSLDDYIARIEESEEYSDEMDDEFKESEIFEYDYRVLDVARTKFEEVYLNPLVKFFNEIEPHKSTIRIIENEGGFGQNDILSSALISSRKKIANTRIYREKLALLRRKIEDELHSNYFLLFTVLGQKVVFNNLFQRILSDVDPDFNEVKCFEVTENYTLQLNRLFDFIKTKNVSLFSKKEDVIIEEIPPSLLDLGTISNSFWEGIIYESNTIIYNTQGIRSFSYLLNEFIKLNESRINNEVLTFDLKNTPYIHSRIIRTLNKRYAGLYSDEQIRTLKDEIINLKNKYILDYFA